MQKLYLSRRNLQTLINKLDRCKREGKDSSACTIIKCDTAHKVYPSTDVVEVMALEDEEYYTDRRPGRVYSPDVPRSGV